METKPFSQKALEALFDCALACSELLPFDCKITSSEFKERQEYSIRFHEGNFLHLTGLRTKLSASDFYKKAISRELRLNDFDCSSNHSLKGIVRIKIRNLRSINTFFDDCLCVQEKLEHGKVHCLIASSNGKYKIGFTGGIRLNPMTLLNKNQIDPSKAVAKFKILKTQRG